MRQTAGGTPREVALLRLLFLTLFVGCGAHLSGDAASEASAEQNPYLRGTPLPLPDLASVVPVWPARAARPRRLLGPGPSRPLRVIIDPGHGAPGNVGNISSFCRLEQDTMLELGLELGRHLARRGYEVRLTRTFAGELPRYQERVREGQAWGGEVLISLHSDIRGWPLGWRPREAGGERCLFRDLAPGFALLYADNGPADRLSRREQLARLLSARLADAGFHPYDGWDYEGLYEADETVRGTFIDRHLPGSRIYMLRHPPMASVIIETFNARNRLESERFQEGATREAFHAAVAAALADYAAIDWPRPRRPRSI
ncbi:MAG: N-acetylmuramoyl-L-alanine amidase [Deltaproteobacteria bacterium]|nr:N-acetylmuramoyl-L-alanine amidase [Deltaproteobacteria bacterium]